MATTGQNFVKCVSNGLTVWYNTVMRSRSTWCVILVLALLLLALTACNTIQPFSTQMGKQAWVQQRVPVSLGSVESTVVLPVGYNFVSDWGDMGLCLSRDNDGYAMYGVWAKTGWILPCKYVEIVRSGSYYMAVYYQDNFVKHEVFDRSGQMIVGTVESGQLQALGEDFFVLYGKKQAQVFGRDGTAYFSDNLFGLSHSFAWCDGYLISYNTTDYSCCLWQLEKDVKGNPMPILLHAFQEKGHRYTPIYTNGRFLVTSLCEGTPEHYTYFEILDGVSYYVWQDAWWFDPSDGSLSWVDLGYVVLGARSRYTVGLRPEDRETVSLADGYTAVSVAVLNEYKLNEYSRYYVMDEKGKLVLTYPKNLNPSALRYREDVGYITANWTAAALYGLDGNMLWQNKVHDYTSMRWQSDRLVACYVDVQGSRYGAFDIDGNIVVPFDYDYLAPFVDGVSIARKGDRYYRIAGDSLEEVEDLACEDYWLAYGCYVVADGNKYALKNLRGDQIATGYDALVTIGTDAQGRVYVLGAQGPDDLLIKLQ